MTCCCFLDKIEEDQSILKISVKKKVMLCKILGGVIIVFLLILLPQTVGKAIIVTTAVDIIPVMQEKSN